MKLMQCKIEITNEFSKKCGLSKGRGQNDHQNKSGF